MIRVAIPERELFQPRPPPVPAHPAPLASPARHRQKKNANTPPRKLLVILAPPLPSLMNDSFDYEPLHIVFQEVTHAC